MAYTRSTTVDASPTGDTAKQAVLDLDADLTAAFAALNELLARRGASLGVASLASDTLHLATEYRPFSGATSSVAGAKGGVPAPSAGDQAKVLTGDGTWEAAPTSPWTVEFYS